MRPSTRFEIKYRIQPALAESIRQWLPRHMEADSFGEGGSAMYDVHSLYLDGDDWSIYRDTRNGAFARFKLRARCYKFEEQAPVFLEVKARQGEAMTKSRAAVSRAEAIRVLAGEIPARSDPFPALENFRTEMDRRRAYPRVWVSYRRSAWVGGERGLVRVTFDDRIKCGPPTTDMSEPHKWWYLPDVKGLVVLEVKYNGSYPQWIAELVRKFDLERKAMSKYRHAVDLIRSGATMGLDAPGTHAAAPP